MGLNTSGQAGTRMISSAWDSISVVAFGGDGDHASAAGPDFLHVADHLVVLAPLGATNTQGMPSWISAMGPCFISAAGMPSAWMYEISLTLRAPSRATG
jgi:hypothetical protein